MLGELERTERRLKLVQVVFPEPSKQISAYPEGPHVSPNPPEWITSTAFLWVHEVTIA
jgi:hypothetical protein